MFLPFQIILASASPRRKEIFEKAGFYTTTVNLNADESFPSDIKSEEIAEFLAVKKAGAFQKKIEENQLLVTADTTVVFKSSVFNKPVDKNQAREMLSALSGNTHFVYTGVCVKSISKSIQFTEKTLVTFKKLSNEEIEFYLNHCKPFDKAGSYGVQDWMGLIGVEKIEGCFYNVMGFPMSRFYQIAMQTFNPAIQQ